MSQSIPHSPRPDDCENVATVYGTRLLADLGVRRTIPTGQPAHPAHRWAESGLMWLTGAPNGVAELCPVPLPSCADATLDAIRTLTGKSLLPGINGGQLLSERAAYTGWSRNGNASSNDHCRLLPTMDGTIALNLARESDWELTPALLCQEVEPSWKAVASGVTARPTDQLVAQAHLLGIAAADATHIPLAQASWFNARALGRKRPRPPVKLMSGRAWMEAALPDRRERCSSV